MKAKNIIMALIASILLVACGGEKKENSEPKKDSVIVKTDSLTTQVETKSTIATPEDLGKAIFESLKKNDKATFTSLLLTKDELSTLLAKMETPEEKKSKELSEFDKDQAERENLFDKVIKEGEKKIKWAESTFSNVLAKTETKKGVEFSELRIGLEHGGKKWIVRTRDCIKLDTGWKLISNLRFAGEDK